MSGAAKPLPPGALPTSSLPYVDDSLAWRDKPWAVAFYVHLAAVCVLAFGYGTYAVTNDAIGINDSTSRTSTEPYDLNADVVIRCVTVAIVSGVLTSLLMLSILRWLGAALIRASFAFSIGSTALVGAGLLALGAVGPAACMFFLAALSAAYYFCVRRRIPFAAAHLAVSSAALKGAPGAVYMSFFLLFAQGVWALLWAFAVLGVEFMINNNGGKPGAGGNTDTSGGTGEGGTVATFAMLLSFFWGSGVIKNVSSFTSASVVGDFWYKGDAARAPVWGALRRALTTSFGTISLGAFLVALCATLRAMKDAAESAAKGKDRNPSPALLAALCIVSCLLWLLTAVIEWANRWAIVYAALTGLAFKPAGLAAVQLFRERGWDEVLNADLVHSALMLAATVSASVGALAGGGLSYFLDRGPERGMHAGLAAALCFFVSMSFALVRLRRRELPPPAPAPQRAAYIQAPQTLPPPPAGADGELLDRHARRVCGVGARARRAAGHAPGAHEGARGRVARGAPRAVRGLRVRARVRRGRRRARARAARNVQRAGGVRQLHRVRKSDKGGFVRPGRKYSLIFGARSRLQRSGG